MGGIKAVGLEAISNIVNERIKNGKFSSINDFIKRVNPKDINKLQLEGLVKAGAFDKLNDNRQSLFDSIPNMISKSKNDFDNKIINQIDLFGDNDENEINLIKNIKDWEFEDKLSKEFEAVVFFISDHPLNQFKEIFSDYKIIDYKTFISDNNLEQNNVAATLLKIQERKTSKGTPYAVIKLTDLSSVFELFIFSDTLEINRNILKEGNSLILTLIKTISGDEKINRINVRKVTSLKDLFHGSIKEVTFSINSKTQLDEIKKFLDNEGKTIVNIHFSDGTDTHNFKLKNLRNVDRKSISLLRNKEISINIH